MRTNIQNVYELLVGRDRKKMLLRATGEKLPCNTQFHAWEEEPPTKEIISTSALMMSTWTTSSTFHQMMVKKWNLATTTGVTIGKTNIEDEQLLNQQEPELFRVGTHQARRQLRNKTNLKSDGGFHLVCIGLRMCRKKCFHFVQKNNLTTW